MKTYSRAGVTLVTAATVLLASAGIAQGYDPNAPATSVAMQIAEVAPKADVVDTAEHDDGFAATAGGTDVEVPSAPDTPVTITHDDPAAPDLSVTLPTLSGTDDARQASDGTIIYTSDDDASIAVQPLEDGSTRFLSVLESKDAPERYEYRFEGADLDLQDDGSIIVRDGDLIAGVIDAPWATDAAGTTVPTHYEVTGDTVTQVVSHTAGDFAYPVTADPWWNPFSWKWSKIGKASVSGLKKCGIGAIGGTGGSLAGNVVVNVVRNAAGKSFISIYGGPYGLIGVAVAGCVGNIIVS